MKWIHPPYERHPTKLGWVVFKDIQDAEACQEHLSKTVLHNSFIEATLLPPHVLSEACFNESVTLQLDNIPPEHCNVPAIRKILTCISREIPQLVTHISVSVLLRRKSAIRQFVYFSHVHLTNL